MIIVLDRSIKDSDKRNIIDFLVSHGLKTKEIVGEEETVIGVVGIVTIDTRDVEILPGVDRVIPITKPFKLASRELKKDDTIIKVGRVRVGGNRVVVIAGPCAVESRMQIDEIASIVVQSGAVMLRGGAFKPRTSPYAFQGLGLEGLKFMKEAGEKYNLPVVSELVATDHIDFMLDYVDVFQIGTRNMQNYELLKKVADKGKPVVLKRGMAATIDEWLMAAEYLMAHGSDDVILCERGIRTFETYTRNTLDLSAIPVVKKYSHLPIIVDPSHATGIREKVPPMSLAAVAAGADGLIIEVHNDPEKALSDGAQSLYPDQFEKLMRDIEALSPVVNKEIERLSQVKTTAVVRKTVSKRGLTAAFQGEHGAFSEIAVFRYFNREETASLPCPSFRAVFEAVLSGQAEHGIVPIENSLAGSIHENYDLLLQFPDLKIVGENMIRIEHNLIGFPGVSLKSLKRIYSHPQALAQSRDFLESLGQVELIPYYDTAGSVGKVKKDGNRENAAVASSEAASLYGMSILKAGIETNPRNYTRFFIIAHIDSRTPPRRDKASLVFSVPDKPGALFRCLGILAEYGLNMKKLESRPIQGKPWQYMFYTDVEMPESDEIFDDVIVKLKAESEDFRVLGIY